jgi:diguanylate cyclase (GGDEF)-like protein
MITRHVDEFDVILCDLRLPKLSGKQLLERTGALIRGRTPVIVMSGVPSLRDALRETRQTAFSVLTKPFESIKLLQDTVEQALKQRRLHQSVARKDARIEDLRGHVEFLATQVTELLAETRLYPLTGLPMRRQLEEDLEELRGGHNQHGAALCLIDMDGFRALNARGYSVGDDAIRWVAKALVAGSRECDRVYRWGGDEFVALIVDVDLAEAVEIGDRLRESVASASRDEAASPAITLSAGVVRVPLHREHPCALIDEAQRHLAEAKRAGGNRVASSLPQRWIKSG